MAFRPRILVVEDEFIIAEALVDCLIRLGCDCLDPIGNLRSAITIAATKTFDAAILDVRLGEELVDPVAELLAKRGIPFGFATGDLSAVPAKWFDRPRTGKPYSDRAIEALKEQLIAGSAVRRPVIAPSDRAGVPGFGWASSPLAGL